MTIEPLTIEILDRTLKPWEVTLRPAQWPESADIALAFKAEARQESQATHVS